ncbi:MAG TPA: ABC transporter substrate-binding protein [Thermoleophilaceae bacterium]|nr:ABC transporter substrate-binding protein [Thermoleophilaceae bacterium]
MRICSLLPSATEIVAELGLIDSLVGVSEECAWPPEVRSKPRVTAAKIESHSLSSAEIDRAVRDSIGDGQSLYTVDAELIDELRPDILITQDLCTVCAVSSGDLASACPVGAEIISLDPGTISEVADTVTLLGERFGAGEPAAAIVGEMWRKVDGVRAAVEGLPRPRVFVAEWTDPPFCAGHWVPEMVDAAGGVEVMGEPGKPSYSTTWDEALAGDPELVVIAPCGFLADEAAARAAGLNLPCRAVAVDADSYFSRPAPRLADGVLQLGHLLHPDAVPDPGLAAIELQPVTTPR